jgi:phage protein Gp37/Gp68
MALDQGDAAVHVASGDKTHRQRAEDVARRSGERLPKRLAHSDDRRSGRGRSRCSEVALGPAVAHGLSIKPQLEPVNITAHASGHDFWVICGGKSGHCARPFDIEWARSLRDQCTATGAAYFMKQIGANPIRLRTISRKGEDPAEWPADIRVRNFLVQAAWGLLYVGLHDVRGLAAAEKLRVLEEHNRKEAAEAAAPREPIQLSLF